MDFAAIQYLTATIASSATTSDEQALPAGATLVGIITPGTLTGSAFTFTAATISGGTFNPVYNEGTQYSVNVGTSRYVAVNPSVFAGIRFFKVVSGSTEGGSRSIVLVVRNV